MTHRTLFIITGMSGAGKTQVIRALEDLGFYCVERLPLELFPKFLELIEGAGGELGPVLALGMDLREVKLDERFPALYDTLRKSSLTVRIVFVEARDDVLLRRFSETRRPHPLVPKGSAEEGIALERARLALIKEKSDVDVLGAFLPTPRCDAQAVNRAAAELGDAGIVMGHVAMFDGYGQPGCWQDAAVLVGIERLIMETYDDPAWVHALLGILQKRKAGYIESLRGARYDLLILGGGDASRSTSYSDVSSSSGAHPPCGSSCGR